MKSLLLLLLFGAQDSVQELVDRYFATEEKKDRTGIAKKLRDFPLSEVEAAVRRGSPGLRVERPGEVWFRDSKTEVGGKEFRYHIWVPASYDPARRYRLIVTLHGTHGKGEHQMNVWAPQMRGLEDTIFVAPTSPVYGWGGSRSGHSHVLTALKEMLRDFPIDPNQVFMGGISMGGTGSFRVPSYVPDYFGGIMPRVQGPRFESDADPRTGKPINIRPKFMENFRNIPIYWIVGKTDKLVPIQYMRAAHDKLTKLKYDVTYIEKETGHLAYGEENPKILEWLKDRKRDPYPEQVVWHAGYKHYTRAYWVEVSRFAKGPQRTYQFKDLKGRTSETRKEYLNKGIIRAKIVKEDNAIEATVRNATEVIFRLSDAMLDLDRKVIIRVNGDKVYEKKVRRSLPKMLEDAYERRDRGMIFSAEVKVKVR